MRPPTLHEVEVALFIEMYIASFLPLAFLIGFGPSVASIAAHARFVWAEWKHNNEIQELQIKEIVDDYARYHLPGPNYVRDRKRQLQREREGTQNAKRRRVPMNHKRHRPT